jgi:large subunit ribosomal protein L22
MPGTKTNERPGTRAVLRHYRMSATKARQVLDLVRGHDVDRAHEILRTTPREAARVVAKVLESAVSNARNNDGLDPDELYVSACYADEGATLKRWRPRARGRATRIRKRTCHITVIVSRLPEDRLARRRARQAASSGALRARRVAASRREAAEEAAEEAAAEKAFESAEGATDESGEAVGGSGEAVGESGEAVDESGEAVGESGEVSEEAEEPEEGGEPPEPGGEEAAGAAQAEAEGEGEESEE